MALGKGQSGAPAALPGLTPAWSRATRQGTWALSADPAALANNSGECVTGWGEGWK